MYITLLQKHTMSCSAAARVAFKDRLAFVLLLRLAAMPRFVVAEREDAEEEESSSEEEQSEEEEEQLESVATDGQEADAGQAAADAARAETNGQAGGSGAGGSGARSKLKIQLGGNKGKLVCHVRAPSYVLSVWDLVRWAALEQCIPVDWPATRAPKNQLVSH